MTETTSNRTSVNLNGIEIPLKRLLGEGLTASVYLGTYREELVAIKILKTDTVREYFLSEYQHLVALRKGWQKLFSDPNNPEILLYPSPVPDYIAGEIREKVENFLIMEFIAGEPLDHWLEIKNVRMEEASALYFITQFGRLMRVLHTELRKCYADIKISNLWILPPEDKPGLKVSDWNVLSEFNPEGQARDLFFASLYLYRILTGTALPYARGQVTAKIDSPELFTELSDGMQLFLRRALHRNLGRRFANAEEWTASLERLLGLWELDAVELNARAAKMLKTAQTAQREAAQAEGDAQKQMWNDSANAYREAMMFLSVSKKKGRGDRETWAALNENANRGLQSTSNLEKGLLYLKGDSYPEAKREFDEGAELSPLEPEALRRWYWLACAAGDLGIEKFNIIKSISIKGVEALINKEVNEALNQLSDACKDLYIPVKTERIRTEDPATSFEQAREEASQLSVDVLEGYSTSEGSLPEGLLALRLEARILKLVDNGRQSQQNGLYSDAIRSYENALALYKKLPQMPPTAWAEDAGALDQLIDATKLEAESAGVALQEQHLARQAIEVHDWTAAGKHFQLALLAMPDDTLTVSEWESAARQCLELAEMDDVLALLAPAMGLQTAKTRLAPLWQKAYQLRLLRIHARQVPPVAFQDSKSKVEIEAQITSVFSKAADFRSAHAGDSFALGAHFKTVLKCLLDSSLEWNRWQTAGQVIELARLVDEAWAREFDTQSQSYRVIFYQRRQRLISELLDEVIALEKEQTLEMLEQAAQKIDLIRSLYDDDYRKTIEQTQIAITSGRITQKQTPVISIEQTLERVRTKRDTLVKAAQKDAEKKQKQIELIKQKLAELDERVKSLSDVLDKLPATDVFFSQKRVEISQELARTLSLAIDQIDRLPGLTLEATEPGGNKRADYARKLTEIEPVPLEQGVDSKPSKPWGWMVATFIFALAALVFGALLVIKTIYPGGVTEPTAIPTLVMTSTTIIPSPSPTATFTPEPSITPEPPPVSKFSIPDGKAQVTILTPDFVEPLYLIDDQDASLPGGISLPRAGQDASRPDPMGNGNSMLVLDSTVQGLPEQDAFVDWPMDIPVQETGYYEVFMSDTRKYSGSTMELRYQVLADGGSLAPVVGTGTLKQLAALDQPKNDKGEVLDAWRSVGIYYFTAGQKITVRLDLTGIKLDATSVIGIDAILIARLPAPPQSAGNILEAFKRLKNIQEWPLMFWADDTDAATIFRPTDGWTALEGDAAQFTWNGAKTIQTTKDGTYQITWSLPHTLPIGKYEVYTWMPPGISGKVTYKLAFLDEKGRKPGADAVKFTPDSFPIDPQEAGMAGSWQSLAQVEVLKDSYNLTVTLSSVNVEAMLAGDVILVVFQP